MMKNICSKLLDHRPQTADHSFVWEAVVGGLSSVVNFNNDHFNKPVSAIFIY
jgi:hypothetical protein